MSKPRQWFTMRINFPLELKGQFMQEKQAAEKAVGGKLSNAVFGGRLMAEALEKREKERS